MCVILSVSSCAFYHGFHIASVSVCINMSKFCKFLSCVCQRVCSIVYVCVFVSLYVIVCVPSCVIVCTFVSKMSHTNPTMTHTQIQ